MPAFIVKTRSRKAESSFRHAPNVARSRRRNPAFGACHDHPQSPHVRVRATLTSPPKRRVNQEKAKETRPPLKKLAYTQSPSSSAHGSATQAEGWVAKMDIPHQRGLRELLPLHQLSYLTQSCSRDEKPAVELLTIERRSLLPRRTTMPSRRNLKAGTKPDAAKSVVHPKSKSKFNFLHPAGFINASSTPI